MTVFMKTLRLRNKLLLGAAVISMVMVLTSMLAVSWVISRQYHNQSSAQLNKGASIINDNLYDRKFNLLKVSRQLATQKNLGSTIWYLGQYAQSDIDRDILFNTYQQLVTDIYKIGKVAKLSRIVIYDVQGKLVSFASFGSRADLVGFAERFPVPVFQVDTLKAGEEFNNKNLRKVKKVAGIDFKFGRQLSQQENVQYAIDDGSLAIESCVPIMGEMFDPVTGKQQTRQLGIVLMVQPLAQDFVDYLGRLTDVKINLFTSRGFDSGNLPAYRNPDWYGVEEKTAGSAFNEIKIGGESFYQSLIPLYTGKHLVGTIAALQSEEIVRKNIREMMHVLMLIAAVSLLLVFPFAWYLANSISRPLIALSGIFQGVARGEQTLSNELAQMKEFRGDELGELAKSFIDMNNAINQKIGQINEINASLEEKIEQRTRQLRSANKALLKLARHDGLTGLPNRQLLNDRLEQALVAAKRDKTRVAVMFIDLDKFKPINDTHGHATGDLLLIEVAKRIQDCIRESDTVSRVGGDEFIVLLPVTQSLQDAGGVAEKIRLALNLPFELAGNSMHISCSIGIAIYPEHGSDENALLRNADIAMYEAKRSGRNAVVSCQTDPSVNQPTDQLLIMPVTP